MTTLEGNRRRSARAALAAAVLVCLSGPGGLATAQNNFELDPEPVGPREYRDATPWVEGAVTLPPWPNDSDLVPWMPEDVDTPFRLLIDSRHLDIDRDGAVVRYTLVAESPSGARNVSVEGIRCTLRGTYKVYAYGSGGRFVRAPAADWQPLNTLGTEAYRYDLWRNRFCVPREVRPRSPSEIVHNLKAKARARSAPSFIAD